jgi:hypothetical protein
MRTMKKLRLLAPDQLRVGGLRGVAMRTLMKMRLLTLLLLLLGNPTFVAASCGDADDSGAVTVTDGVQTLRAAAGLSSTCTPARCDLDGGGSISVSDGVNVLRAAAGVTVNLACPGSAATCTAANVTVTLAVPEPIGAATLTLAYPTSVVSLPGSGDAAAARVTILTSASLFNAGEPNDRDTDVTFALVATDGLDDGDLLRVRFDCLGAAPSASQFGCMLADVFAPDALTKVSGATCRVTVVAE